MQMVGVQGQEIVNGGRPKSTGDRILKQTMKNDTLGGAMTKSERLRWSKGTGKQYGKCIGELTC